MSGSKNCGTFIQWNKAAEKKTENSYLFATEWIELESVMLSEISQSVKHKHHKISLVRGI